MKTTLLLSVGAVLGALTAPAHAETEITWWHGMGGALGETVNKIAAANSKPNVRAVVIIIQDGIGMSSESFREGGAVRPGSSFVRRVVRLR